MKLTSLLAYSLTWPHKTAGSLCAYFILSLLAPSILWNKMTSCSRQAVETAACAAVRQPARALPMMLPPISSLSKPFNEKAGIHWCRENHLSRLAVVLYHIKEELYPFLLAENMKHGSTRISTLSIPVAQCSVATWLLKLMNSINMH